MHISAKAGLTALLAALLLAVAISSSSARNFSVSNQNIRATWSSLEFASSLVTIRCQVTLEGSFHSRTVAKVARTLVGAITRAVLKTEGCTNGQASARALPWHITYEGFTGVLPNVTSVRLLVSRFLLHRVISGITCDYGTATDNITLAANINAASEVTELSPVAGRNTASLLEGGAFCPATGSMNSAAGDGRVALLGTVTRIRVTLI